MKPIEELISIIQSLSGKYSPYTIFSDWIEMMALEISNTINVFHCEIWQEREKNYIAIKRKYDGKEFSTFAKMLALLTEALEEEMTDVLGEVFMRSGTSSGRHGQFFTPFDVSELCAKLSLDLNALDEDECIELNEPSSGAGGMIIAAAKILKDNGINYQKRLKVTAQDLDWRGVYMTYVQLSLLGVKARCVQGDTLREPYVKGYDGRRVMYTPAWMGLLI